MYPGFAKTARDEGFDEIAEWLETLARAEKSHAGRFSQGLEIASADAASTGVDVARGPGCARGRRRSPSAVGGATMRKLTVDDIVDLRAYERERDEFRRRHHRDEEAAPGRARRRS